MQKRKGISLIVLVITIIVMVILAGAIILTLNNSGIINKASEAVEETNLATVKEVASLAWAEAYADGVRAVEDLADGTKGFETRIKEVLAKNNIDLDKYELEVTTSGVEVSLKNETKVTWTKTSEGDLTIGSIVKTSTDEEFYVIGGDTAGTPITSSTEKVLLLAKNNLKADGTAQDPTGALNSCPFSSTSYWSSANTFPADLNDTEKYPIPEGTTSIVSVAKTYGASLGATGRLMTLNEVEALGGNRNTNSTSDCPGFINSTDYWLGSASDFLGVWYVYVSGGYYSLYYSGSSDLEDYSVTYGGYFGLRPVVEIPKTSIQ